LFRAGGHVAVAKFLTADAAALASFPSSSQCDVFEELFRIGRLTLRLYELKTFSNGVVQMHRKSFAHCNGCSATFGLIFVNGAGSAFARCGLRLYGKGDAIGSNPAQDEPGPTAGITLYRVSCAT
jgi:hypothetical protein